MDPRVGLAAIGLSTVMAKRGYLGRREEIVVYMESAERIPVITIMWKLSKGAQAREPPQAQEGVTMEMTYSPSADALGIRLASGATNVRTRELAPSTFADFDARRPRKAAVKAGS